MQTEGSILLSHEIVFYLYVSQANSVLDRQHTVSLCWKMYPRRLFLLHLLS